MGNPGRREPGPLALKRAQRARSPLVLLPFTAPSRLVSLNSPPSAVLQIESCTSLQHLQQVEVSAVVQLQVSSISEGMRAARARQEVDSGSSEEDVVDYRAVLTHSYDCCTTQCPSCSASAVGKSTSAPPLEVSRR